MLFGPIVHLYMHVHIGIHSPFKAYKGLIVYIWAHYMTSYCEETVEFTSTDLCKGVSG